MRRPRQKLFWIGIVALGIALYLSHRDLEVIDQASSGRRGPIENVHVAAAADSAADGGALGFGTLSGLCFLSCVLVDRKENAA